MQHINSVLTELKAISYLEHRLLVDMSIGSPAIPQYLPVGCLRQRSHVLLMTQPVIIDHLEDVYQ
jgi:hypothetical protein